MPAVLAFCDSCGTPFNSGIFVENSKNITFTGNKSGPCPKCGGMGHVPDGVFNFIGSTIEILSAPERTLAELFGLSQILIEGRAKSQSVEQIATRIEKELPALVSIAKLLPTNKNELYGFLAVVLAAVTLYTQAPDKQPSQTIVNINHVVQQITMVQPEVAKSQIHPPIVEKQGRNESCQCGSGKKFKKCCGALR